MPKLSKAMVVFHEDADVSQYESMSRSARHQVEQKATEERRRELLDKLKQAGLDKEAEVPEATPMSMLLVSASERAIDEMRKTPCVKDVLPMADELGVDLLGSE
jgi:predicted transcriptional regulator